MDSLEQLHIKAKVLDSINKLIFGLHNFRAEDISLILVEIDDGLKHFNKAKQQRNINPFSNPRHLQLKTRATDGRLDISG